ncbi:hypothetical protein AOLI_G00089670 [Acnodon oligacanthus]
MLIILLSGFWIAGAVIRIEEVDNATHAEEYRCIVDGDDAATKYTWHRQGQKSLPEGAKAEGDTLHFLKLTPDLNGLYFCEAANRFGVSSASLYKCTKKESFLSWILTKAVLGLPSLHC